MKMGVIIERHLLFLTLVLVSGSDTTLITFILLLVLPSGLQWFNIFVKTWVIVSVSTDYGRLWSVGFFWLHNCSLLPLPQRCLGNTFGKKFGMRFRHIYLWAFPKGSKNLFFFLFLNVIQIWWCWLKAKRSHSFWWSITWRYARLG